jgi:hypothetical protein
MRLELLVWPLTGTQSVGILLNNLSIYYFVKEGKNVIN